MPRKAGGGRPDSPVTAELQRLVSAGALSLDAPQVCAASVLDRIARELSHRPGFVEKLAGRNGVVRGAYLVGGVGRGKTMLMDLLFAEAAVERKRRLHFHELMEEVHAGIANFRASARGKREDADPVTAATKPILATTRLLCLDEFQVNDITNAMLLDRLFEKLFAGGVTLVATSNTLPDDLYRDGLNRELFLPFIEMLKDNTQIVPLDGPMDYRGEKFVGQQVFRFGTRAAVQAEMETLWRRLTGGVAGEPCDIESLGRKIHVPRAAMGAARFGFADLCEKPLGARDYLRIAHAFDTLMIENVPQFDRTRTDASKRFILLIDTLYDRGIKLSASFAVPLDELARDAKTAGEFARTTSRLIEMQSEDYLAAPHKASAVVNLDQG